MELTFAAATDVGRQRQHNEDNFLIDKKLRLFLVADGMGGHAAGEVASSIAVHEIRDAIYRNRDLIDRYRADQPGVQAVEILQVLEHAIQAACSTVYNRAQAESDKRGMGTTATVLLIAGSPDHLRGFIAHVGDSRVYLARQDQCHVLTEDHSLMNELIRRGKLDKSQIDSSPYKQFKNAVTRAVGVYASVEVDTFDFDILPGDNFLLCSDGLYAYLDEATLTSMLSDGDVKDAPAKLIGIANAGGGHDNITSVVVRARRRLRRHRHLPALRHQGVLRPPSTASPPPRTCSACSRSSSGRSSWWSREVRLVHPARRQPRRGRHPRPARAGRAAQPRPRQAKGSVAAGPARALRRGPALRRRDHHPRHLGALRGRGPRGRHHAVQPLVVPITVVILVGLFLVQKRGTAGIGASSAPPRCWCGSSSIAALGLPWILAAPRCSAPSTPARRALLRTRTAGTASCCWARWCSASPAARPSTPTWATSAASPSARLVRRGLPGAAAQLLRPGRPAARARRGGASANPFFGLVSGWLLYPMVAIATVATVVASQALISGRVLAHPAGGAARLLPRVTIVHTSGSPRGRSTSPRSTGLMVACIALVLAFGSRAQPRRGLRHRRHGHDAITSVLFSGSRGSGAGPCGRASRCCRLFLVIDLAFFGANVVKIGDGGWLPLVDRRGGLHRDDHVEAGRLARSAHHRQHPCRWTSSSTTCARRSPTA
jgi:serine/threonine protein phosphatase PrpC